MASTDNALFAALCQLFPGYIFGVKIDVESSTECFIAFEGICLAVVEIA